MVLGTVRLDEHHQKPVDTVGQRHPVGESEAGVAIELSTFVVVSLMLSR
jgi:hypothetical protein